MPYLNDIDAEEQRKKQEAQGGPQAIAGQSSVINGSSSQQPGGQKESGSYTNLNQYLEANKDQAASMGAKIANDVSTQGVKSTEGINNFRQTAAPEVKAYDPSSVYQNVITLQDSDKAAYKTAKAGYQGPQAASEVEGWGDLQKNVSKVNTQAQNAATDTGRQSLLQETYARPQYTQGQKNLDSMLLGRSPESKQQLEEVHQDFGGISKLLDEANSEVGNRINNNIKTGYANQQAIAAGDVQAKKSLLDPITARAAQMNQENSGLISRITGDLSDDVLSQETLDRLGLTEGQKLYGANLSSYLRPDQTTVGLDNAATAEERARYAALTALIDGQAGQAITANGKQINPISFDRARFDADQAAREAELNRIFADTNFTGSGSWEDEILGTVIGSASGNVANYLKDPNSITSSVTNGGLRMDPNQQERSIQNSQAIARQNLFDQINAFLEEQKYNRTIKKG